MKHPIQPLAKDSEGTLRFKENALIRFLLDNGKHDLNDLASMDFSQEDREQFAQLIGYSLSGFSELSYVSDEAYHAAARMAKEGMSEKDARIKYLTELVSTLRKGLREPMAELFGVDPSDLKGRGYEKD